MSSKPKNSWEATYGRTDNAGGFTPGVFQRKRNEIKQYFQTNSPHGDFRDFFAALGVMEADGRRYAARSPGGKYRGMYQMDQSHLDYIDFFGVYGKPLGVKNMDDFQKNPKAQETAALLSFMGTPGGKDSRFRTTAKAVRDYNLDYYARRGTVCDVTFVDRNNQGWQKTVQIKITPASVSAATHLLGEGAMGDILNRVIAGHESGIPARIEIDDPHVHDGNNVLFTAYMQLTQDYDMSEIVDARPSQAFDPCLSRLLEGRKGEIGSSSAGSPPADRRRAPGKPGTGQAVPGANVPGSPPRSRTPRGFLDSIGKGIFDAYRSVTGWFSPEAASRRPVAPAPPAAPGRSGAGARLPENMVSPDSANKLGPSPFPASTGEHLRFDLLPGTVGAGERVPNKLGLPPSPAVVRAPSGPGPSPVPLVPLRRSALIPEPASAAGVDDAGAVARNAFLNAPVYFPEIVYERLFGSAPRTAWFTPGRGNLLAPESE